MQDCYAGADPALPAADPRHHRDAPGTACSRATCSSGADAEERRASCPTSPSCTRPASTADPGRDGTRIATFIVAQLRAATGPDRRHARTPARSRSRSSRVMNYLLPQRRRAVDALLGQRRRAAATSALFFGLSGTGKTTLSADPTARSIGDDEHGWSDDGVFNFEGGCYAKVIHLSRRGRAGDLRDHAPLRHGARERRASIRDTRGLDLDDDTLTENTRARYPLDYIPNAVAGGQARPSREHHLPDRRRLRRAAADRAADAGAGDVPLPLRLHRQGRRHRARRHRAARRPSAPASARRSCRCTRPSTPSCSASASPRHGAPCWLVNTGWTRRPVRRRPAHEDAYTRAHGARGAVRRAGQRGAMRPAPKSWACWSPRGLSRRAERHSRSEDDLVRCPRLRPQGTRRETVRGRFQTLRASRR